MKTKAFTYFLFMAAILMNGCSMNENDMSDTLPGIPGPPGYRIFFQNSSGEDLLNPENHYITVDDVRIYFVVDGKKEEVWLNTEGVSVEGPRGFAIIPPEPPFSTEYIFEFGVNYKEQSDWSETIIDWGNGDVDTVRTKLYRNEYNQPTGILEGWYNGEKITILMDEEKHHLLHNYEFAVIKEWKKTE
jgi:hypothetical protein